MELNKHSKNRYQDKEVRESLNPDEKDNLSLKKENNKNNHKWGIDTFPDDSHEDLRSNAFEEDKSSENHIHERSESSKSDCPFPDFEGLDIPRKSKFNNSSNKNMKFKRDLEDAEDDGTRILLPSSQMSFQHNHYYNKDEPKRITKKSLIVEIKDHQKWEEYADSKLQ